VRARLSTESTLSTGPGWCGCGWPGSGERECYRSGRARGPEGVPYGGPVCAGGRAKAWQRSAYGRSFRRERGATRQALPRALSAGRWCVWRAGSEFPPAAYAMRCRGKVHRWEAAGGCPLPTAVWGGDVGRPAAGRKGASDEPSRGLRPCSGPRRLRLRFLPRAAVSWFDRMRHRSCGQASPDGRTLLQRRGATRTGRGRGSLPMPGAAAPDARRRRRACRLTVMPSPMCAILVMPGEPVSRCVPPTLDG
jgi:hypothetical protein